MTEGRANRLKDATDLVRTLSKEIQASSVARDAIMKDLLKDLDGQVTEALSRTDWYDKWGKHFLPSLKGAHLNQQCNNFKDPGVQHYCGKLFKKIRDDVDATFLQLPPPKPSQVQAVAPSSSSSSSSRSAGSSSGGSAPRPKVSMSYYNTSSNPCFAASSLMHMANGSRKVVSDVKRGDLVMSSKGNTAQIRCVVRTLTTNGRTQLVALPSGLLVTPYHPIRVKNEWSFPRDITEPQDCECDAVYSFLLEDSTSEHVVVINDVECVALAHGLSHSKVVEHAYFGSNLVITDLERMSGWSQGNVQLVEGCLVRDNISGLVVGLRQESS
jgi:hypothetical protein